jgi:hypothetical protein
MHEHMRSWRKVGEALGINETTANRYALTDYEPKREDIREALGLDVPLKVDYIRQKRGKNGRFK